MLSFFYYTQCMEFFFLFTVRIVRLWSPFLRVFFLTSSPLYNWQEGLGSEIGWWGDFLSCFFLDTFFFSMNGGRVNTVCIHVELCVTILVARCGWWRCVCSFKNTMDLGCSDLVGWLTRVRTCIHTYIRTSPMSSSSSILLYPLHRPSLRPLISSLWYIGY